MRRNDQTIIEAFTAITELEARYDKIERQTLRAAGRGGRSTQRYRAAEQADLNDRIEAAYERISGVKAKTPVAAIVQLGVMHKAVIRLADVGMSEANTRIERERARRAFYSAIRVLRRSHLRRGQLPGLDLLVEPHLDPWRRWEDRLAFVNSTKG